MSPTGDFPQMAASNLANASYGGAQMMGNAAFISNNLAQQCAPEWDSLEKLIQAQNAAREHYAVTPPVLKGPTTKQEKSTMPARRIVQVYIADPSDAVPLEDAILYTGEQKMTDLTDQELFFEIDMRSILEAHNAKRAKIIDKSVKDRVEHLEPVKVRDLKMVVVTVASF